MDTGLSKEKDERGWLEARYDGVTCTDLGKIMGVDPGTSRTRLLLSKIERRDLLEDCSDVTRTLVALGQRFEPRAREAFLDVWTSEGDRNGWVYDGDKKWEKLGFVPSMHVHRDHNFFTGTPDYLLPGMKVAVEFKTHFYPNVEEARPIMSVDMIPLKYYLQLQGYLEIMDYPMGILVSWTLKNGMMMYIMRRDTRLFRERVLPSIRQFKFWMDTLGAWTGPGPLGIGRFRSGERAASVAAVYQSLMYNTDVLWDFRTDKINK